MRTLNLITLIAAASIPASVALANTELRLNSSAVLPLVTAELSADERNSVIAELSEIERNTFLAELSEDERKTVLS